MVAVGFAWLRRSWGFVKREKLTLAVLVLLVGFAVYGAWSISHEIKDNRDYNYARCEEQHPPTLQAAPPGEHKGRTPEQAKAGQDPGEGARIARVANCLAADANQIASRSLFITGWMAIFTLFAFVLSALAVIVAVRVDRHRIDAPADRGSDEAAGR